jgi:hypothetical protein
MTDAFNPADAEFSAMKALYAALEPLDDDARKRVVSYIVARLEIATPGAAKPAGGIGAALSDDDDEPSTEKETKAAPKYHALAELYDATQPRSNADKALVAGYWIQVCQEADSFDGFSANKELKHLGHGLANITNAVDILKAQKPALAIQLKKSGKSQQARKLYKITASGIKAVEAMISG